MNTFSDGPALDPEDDDVEVVFAEDDVSANKTTYRPSFKKNIPRKNKKENKVETEEDKIIKELLFDPMESREKALNAEIRQNRKILKHTGKYLYFEDFANNNKEYKKMVMFVLQDEYYNIYGILWRSIDKEMLDGIIYFLYNLSIIYKDDYDKSYFANAMNYIGEVLADHPNTEFVKIVMDTLYLADEIRNTVNGEKTFLYTTIHSLINDNMALYNHIIIKTRDYVSDLRQIKRSVYAIYNGSNPPNVPFTEEDIEKWMKMINDDYKARKFTPRIFTLTGKMRPKYDRFSSFCSNGYIILGPRRNYVRELLGNVIGNDFFI